MKIKLKFGANEEICKSRTGEEACAWLGSEEALRKVKRAFEFALRRGKEAGFPLCGHRREPGELVIGEESAVVIKEKCPLGTSVTGRFHVHVPPVEEDWTNEYFSPSYLLNTFLLGQKGFCDCVGYVKGGKMYVKCYEFPGKDELLRSDVPRLLGKLFNLAEKGLTGKTADEYEDIMRKVESALRVCTVEIGSLRRYG